MHEAFHLVRPVASGLGSMCRGFSWTAVAGRTNGVYQERTMSMDGHWPKRGWTLVLKIDPNV
jgi:hypothetical protein